MKIIECPRDAMQGIARFIPTEKKAAYINQLLRVGFHTIDFGSFVSPKAIPQMRDTAEVLDLLEIEDSTTRLLAIVANRRGALDASIYEHIHYLGYPLSLSETFQRLNTNSSITEAKKVIGEIQTLCINSGKELVIYLSMGFGNPYGDPYDQEVIGQQVEWLRKDGIGIVSLADTVGVATPAQVYKTVSETIATFPEVEVGVHLHATAGQAGEKIRQALEAGCQRIDGALLGYGGCPMAANELVGNIPTENILNALPGLPEEIDPKQLAVAISLAQEIFKT